MQQLAWETSMDSVLKESAVEVGGELIDYEKLAQKLMIFLQKDTFFVVLVDFSDS